MKNNSNLSKKKITDMIFVYGVLLWPILHFFVFWFCMNLATLKLSFFYGNINNSYFCGFENYKNIFNMLIGTKESGINNHYALLNVISLIPLNLLINLPITLFFSFGIFRKIYGYKLFRVLLFLPAMISATVLCLVYKMALNSQIGIITEFFQNIGLGNIIPQGGWFGNKDSVWNTIVVFSVWTGISGNLIYFCSSMARVPDSVIESAKIDGARELSLFFKFVIPMIWPTLITISVASFAACFAWFMPSLLFTGATEPMATTLSLIIVSTTKNSSANIGDAAAISVFVSIIGGILIVVFRKIMEKVIPEVEY